MHCGYLCWLPSTTSTAPSSHSSHGLLRSWCVRVGLARVLLCDPPPLLGSRRGGVGVDDVLGDHPRLRKDELEHRVVLVRVPVDAVERVTAGLEAVDLDEQLAFDDVADVNAVPLEHRDDATESVESGIRVALPEERRPALEQPGMARVRCVQPAEQAEREQLLGRDELAGLIAVPVAVHHDLEVGRGDARRSSKGRLDHRRSHSAALHSTGPRPPIRRRNEYNI
jgi:hypothetical protein